ENLRQYTDEIQLHGKALNNKLTFLIGGFYFNSAPNGPFGGIGTSQDLLAAFGLGAPSVTGNPSNPNAVPFGYGFYSEQSTAVFFNLSYDLSGLVHGLTLDGGFRYTTDKYQTC